MANQSKKVINSLQREIGHDFDRYNEDLLKNLKELTPVYRGDDRRGGTARKGWKNKYTNKIGKRKSFDLIENKVPYIGVLDTGSSTQAPKGIVEPALKKTKTRKKRR